MIKATYSGSSISQEEWDKARELAERWRHVTDGAQYGEAGKNLGVLARAFRHLEVCYDEMVKIHADTPLPEVATNERYAAMVEATKSHVDGRDLLYELNPNGAHYINIHVRINGAWKVYEGDWLKRLMWARDGNNRGGRAALAVAGEAQGPSAGSAVSPLAKPK